MVHAALAGAGSLHTGPGSRSSPFQGSCVKQSSAGEWEPCEPSHLEQALYRALSEAVRRCQEMELEALEADDFRAAEGTGTERGREQATVDKQGAASGPSASVCQSFCSPHK